MLSKIICFIIIMVWETLVRHMVRHGRTWSQFDHHAIMDSSSAGEIKLCLICPAFGTNGGMSFERKDGASFGDSWSYELYVNLVPFAECLSCQEISIGGNHHELS